MLVVGCNLCLAQPNLSAPKNLISSISYCETLNHEDGISDAISCSYQQRDKVKFHQGANVVRWIKLDVQANQNDKVAIYVGPHFLGQVNFYEESKGEWLSQTAGSTISASDSHSLIGGYYFVSSPSEKIHPTFYLRVEGSGLNNLDIRANAWPSSNLRSTDWALGIGLQLGGLILIFLFAAYSYLYTPTATLGRFCLLILSLVLCTLSGSGILAKSLFINTPWLDGVFFLIFLGLRLAFWTWVAQGFLASYHTPSWYKNACNALYFIIGLCLILSLFDQLPIIQPVLLAGFLIAPLIQLIATLKTQHIKTPFRKVLVLGFTGSALLVWLTLIINIFPLNESPLPIYISRMTDFANPLILLSLIGLQNRQTRQDLAEVTRMLTVANLEKEFEKKLLAERGILIDMLTHELKNPLASINLAIGSLNEYFKFEDSTKRRRIENIARSVNSMDSIIERVSFMNALEHKELPVSKTSVCLETLITRIIEVLPEKARISISFDNTQLHHVETDTYFLKIILSNLIDNALKYSPQYSLISIDISSQYIDGRNTLITAVTNEVTEELKPDPSQLFERYYRNPHANAISGSGLGLFLIKRIAQIIGAEVYFKQQNSSVSFSVAFKI